MTSALPTAPTYRSARPFSELCFAGQRTKLIERWARIIDPTCFDLPFHHPLVEGAKSGARNENVACAFSRLENHRGWGVDRSRDEELTERGYAFGLLVQARLREVP
jgi:hypothetical protein